MENIIEHASVLSQKAYLSNEIIGGYRLTFLFTTYDNGWKKREVLLPEGVEMSGNCTQVAFYKKNEPFTKIEYKLFGQLHTRIIYAEKPNPRYIF